MLLLLVAYLAAEPVEIPKNVRQYFERQERQRDVNIQVKEQAVKDMEVAIKSEPLAKRKAAMTGQLHKMEDAVAKAKKVKEPAELAIVGRPEKGDVGMLPGRLMVHAIVDDDTLILRDELTAVIVEMPTKGLKARTWFRSEDLWEVTELGAGGVEVKRYVPDMAGIFGCYTAKPLKAAEVKQYRQAYQAEQKKPAE
jgi:hypothetical protein